ncbi:hypothetical protein JAAARDRAFT_413789 [Jaapia argillacea MUCL 33604]|uniref:Uncharacterized protein n=1 Tax=Jaapia argillacea MUCL 33604 TaxID=933084 RepID=A0A067PK04_9AGAM|nr:hypothetical protein JAAARDRAFT_413789 [Jaapia argillacea MUCL 33604]
MFGCCVAGRLLQTNITQIDESHACFELPNAGAINHICVFLLGTGCFDVVPFPDGYGATVHFYWPGRGFQLLGMLSNEKPSAIFRLKGTFMASTSSAAHTAFSSGTNTPTITVDGIPNMTEVTAVLGLAIEPLSTISQEMALLPSSLSRPNPTNMMADPSILAERIVKHLFNYVSSFVSGPGVGITPESMVQMGVIARWYDSFLSKIRFGGVGFLERDA